MNLAFLQKNTDTHKMINTVSALNAVADATAFSSAEKQKWWWHWYRAGRQAMMMTVSRPRWPRQPT